MHLSALFLTVFSATLVTSLALPLTVPGSVRITNQTPAFDSAGDGNTPDRRRQGRRESGPPTDWPLASDSTETFSSKCSYDCSGKKREVNRPETDTLPGLEGSAGERMTKGKRRRTSGETLIAKRSCSSHGCDNAEEGGVDVDGTNWDNDGSAWDN